MFNSNRKEGRAAPEVTTLIAAGTEIHGDIVFKGRLHVDGMVEGAVHGDGPQAMLTLSEHARVVGELNAPHIVINGSVAGDVTALDRLELASNARVEGNVYYKILEMSAGAQINGKMVHRAEAPKQLPKPDGQTSEQPAGEKQVEKKQADKNQEKKQAIEHDNA